MKPQIIAQREKAFRTFLIFFLLTITVVVGAVFFSVQVPLKQNAQLLSQVAQTNQEKLFVEEFALLMDESMRKLDSINLPGVKAEQLDAQLEQLITTMRVALSNKKPSSEKQLYEGIVLTMSELKRSKKEAREVSHNSSIQEQLKSENLTLQQQLRDVNTRYQMCQFELTKR